LKTRFLSFFTRIWLVLSEVPGWPDAPLTVRLRRIAPILVALIGVVAIVAWERGWRDPERHRIRASHSPLVGLDEEINQLRLVCSDQQAAESATEAEAAAAILLDSPDEVEAMLRDLRDRIRAQGWEAVFQAYDATTDVPETAGAVQFVVARASLTPVEGKPAAFQSLLGVFDQISAAHKRIDLTRLGVRADEPGKLEVELNLRIACRVPHEEAS
jgi:hypothetical protein